jgi:Helix-hairpin-helix domain
MRIRRGSSTPADARDESRLDAQSVAAALTEIGQRLILAGENPFKAGSYTRAAESLLLLSEPLEDIVAAGRLKEIPGVGTALAETIEQLHWHGTAARLETMRADIPASLLELLPVPGCVRRGCSIFIEPSASPASTNSKRPAGRIGSQRRRALARPSRARCLPRSSCCVVRKGSGSSITLEITSPLSRRL